MCIRDSIISDSEDPEQKWYHVNLEYSNKWPVITEKKDPLPEAEEYANITDKYDKHFSDKSGGD